MGPLAEPPVGRNEAAIQRLTLIACVLLAAAVLLAACGDGTGDSATPTESAAPERASPEVTSAAPTPSSPAGEAAGTEESFQAEQAMEHLRQLAVEIGVRAAATDGEAEAAEYIREALTSYGYEASIQPFAVESYQDLETTLEVLSPVGYTTGAQALRGSATGEVEAELVFAGLGRPQEFPDGTAGKIALIERGDIFFTEKVSNAHLAGAVGVVIYNNDAGPFVGALSNPSEIPAVTLSRNDGQALLEAAEAGPVVARLSVDAEVISGSSRNVVVRPPGGVCRGIVGGHLDSVPDSPGGNDNASGTAVVLEIARALAADASFEDVCFALFGAEEVGLVGSRYFVTSMEPAEREGIEWMLNFDMLGVGNDWPFVGSAELTGPAAEIAADLGLPHRLSDAPPGVGSDHASFIDAGIPAILFNCFCDPNYHTPQDRADFIEQARLEAAGTLGLRLIDRLLSE